MPKIGDRERIDKYIARFIENASRTKVQKAIDLGYVTVNGDIVKSNYLVKPEDEIEIELDVPEKQDVLPENIPLTITFEDEYLLVINKPPGMVVHPAYKNYTGTLVNAILYYSKLHDGSLSNLNGFERAGIVHRLDKDTSGLMVVARTRAVMDSLVKAIAARDVSRQYLACAHHPWRGAARRTVDAPIGRDPRNRLRMAVVDLAVHPGKTAKTDFVLLENGLDGCLVRCILHTGRTHQIRVHMASLGHPLVADQVYGGGIHATMSRQALHAVHLSFVHPHTLEQQAFEAPLPADFKALLHAWGLRYNPPTRVVNP